MKRLWLLLPVIQAVILVNPVQAASGCAAISIVSNESLALGMLRTRPGAEGFFTLYPDNRMASSGKGASHQGTYGAGQADIFGPPEARATLFVETAKQSDHDTGRLSLSELRLSGTDEITTLEAQGGEVSVTFPARVDSQGRAKVDLRIGAVFRYRHGREAFTSDYSVMIDCIGVSE